MSKVQKTFESGASIPYVSLFSGGMGLDVGLDQAGFQPVVCNEIDRACAETIKLNRPTLPVATESITELDPEKLSKLAGRSLDGIPLIAGGPPCQAFSVYGNRLGVEDVRGVLVFEFLRLVSDIRPQTFLMENVRGLHSMAIIPKSTKARAEGVAPELMEHGSLLREIIRKFEAIGYRLDCFLVNVVNYGGPQIRERLICIGNRYNLVATFPQPSYSNRRADGLRAFRTLGDAIGKDFHDPDPTLMNFSPRKLRYLAMVPAGGNWRSLPVEIQKESMGKAWYLKGGRSAYWRKLSFEFPSPTVVTMPNHAGTSMCHPVHLRALTVGECAAIQEFPREWKFSGSPAEKYRQVGNAVPPRLGKVAGEVIKQMLTEIAGLKTQRSKEKPIPSRIQHIRPHVRTRVFWRNGQSFAGDFSYTSAKNDQQLPLFDLSR